MRIGHGYDAHVVIPGDGVVLGGVSIACDLAMVAHSDGDVVIHALCDALLGAASLGDIGHHFPDSSDDYKDIDSRVLLRDVVVKLKGCGLSVSNVDITVIAEAPRMAAHIDAMCDALSDDLDIAVDRVNVKATTTEKMGFTGRGEGIASHAVVLLDECPDMSDQEWSGQDE